MARLVIRNGRFATGDTISGRAEAVAIDGGRFIAVGKSADCVGPANCDIVAPFCDGDLVLSYTTWCYEGCVHRSECAE
jgi:hypothetical protein